MFLYAFGLLLTAQVGPLNAQACILDVDIFPIFWVEVRVVLTKESSKEVWIALSVSIELLVVQKKDEESSREKKNH